MCSSLETHFVSSSRTGCRTRASLNLEALMWLVMVFRHSSTTIWSSSLIVSRRAERALSGSKKGTLCEEATEFSSEKASEKEQLVLA